MSNHDNHYRNIEANGLIEPIVRMESTICLGLPVEYHAIARRNLNLAMADKHIGRVGQKAGEVEDKELEKAGNYLHRARTGSWRPVAEDLPLFAEPSQGSVVTLSVAPDATAKDINEAAATAIATLEANCRHSFAVTTHGKQSEATESEVGKAVAELQKAPTPNAPVQPRRKYPVVRECATCKHLGARKACTTDGCFKYSLWEPKPEEARVVPRGCASCADGPGNNCVARRNWQCASPDSPEFPLWVAK